MSGLLLSQRLSDACIDYIALSARAMHAMMLAWRFAFGQACTVLL